MHETGEAETPQVLTGRVSDIPRGSLSPRIGDGQFERAIELILEPQLCFPHRGSRRITLKLLASEIFLHAHIREDALAIGVAFIIVKQLNIAAVHGAEFHRRPGRIQLRPPPNRILRLNAERLWKDDHMPGDSFVEIIPAVRDLRRDRLSVRQRWIGRHDGRCRNDDLSRIGVHPDLDDLTVGKLMGIHRVKYHVLIFVRILLINSLTVDRPRCPTCHSRRTL